MYCTCKCSNLLFINVSKIVYVENENKALTLRKFYRVSNLCTFEMRLCFCWVPGIDWLLPLVVRAACGHCVTTRSTPTADSCVVLSCINIDTRVVNTICFRPGTPSHAVPWQLAGRRHRGCAAWTLPWGTASDYAALQGDVGTTRVNATATWAVPAAASLAVQHRLKLSLFNGWTDSGRRTHECFVLLR